MFNCVAFWFVELVDIVVFVLFSSPLLISGTPKHIPKTSPAPNTPLTNGVKICLPKFICFVFLSLFGFTALNSFPSLFNTESGSFTLFSSM